MSNFLFARPSFWEGVARIVDMGGTFQVYNTSRDGTDADRRALQSDWEAVGQDMWTAIQKVDREVIRSKSKK
jgi:hypothetical protein